MPRAGTSNGSGRSRGSSRGRGRGRGRSNFQVSSSTPQHEDEHQDNSGEATEVDMIELGMRVVGAMTEDDMNLFLDRLFTECPMNDKMLNYVRCRHVNWEAVAFGAYGSDECQAAWLYLKTGTRKYRIMGELVQEVKLTLQSSNFEKATYQKKMLASAPGFPKKPPGIAGGFQMFCAEMWATRPSNSGEKNFIVFQSECLDLYKSLSKEQQDKLQHKSEMAKAEYAKQIKEFTLQHPGCTTLTMINKDGVIRRRIKGEPKEVKPIKLKYTNVPVPPLTPHLLFIQTKLNKLEVPPTREELPELKAKYKKKWMEMSEKRKAKWIEKFINKSQNYIIELEDYRKRFPAYIPPKDFKIRKRVSKNEIEIWEKFRGKPTQPPLTSFDVFFLDFLKKNPQFSTLPVEEGKEVAREKWKALDYYHKAMYKINLRKLNLEFKKDLEEYIDRLPSLIRPFVLESVPKKFKNVLLTSVDKVMETDLETGNDDSQYSVDLVENGEKQIEESEALPGRKNKNIKQNSQDTIEEMDENDNTFTEENLNSDTEHIKKKKKRKRKRSHSEDVSTIKEEDEIGRDFEENNDEFYTEEGEDNTPLYEKELGEEDWIQILEQQKEIPKLSRKHQSHKKKNISKPKIEDWTQKQAFTSRHLYDVIRGIFDARQNFGRRYSVFYYYSKYVANEYIWVEKVNCIGLVETAEQIYKTFLSLSNFQKQLFVDESFDFHSKSSMKESRYDNTDHWGRKWDKSGFPGEPKPPPRTTKRLYMSEVKVLQKTNKNEVFPTWEELSEVKQNLYIKKLYRISNLYLQEYENFVSKMTPSDMVAYTVHCYKVWEDRFLTINAGHLAVKGFTFPLPKRELSGLERDPSPEIIIDEELKNRKLRQLQKKNEEESHFDNDELINVLTEGVQPTDAEPMNEDQLSDNESDDPSDEELLRTGRGYKNWNRRIIGKNEIKRMSTYNYPLQFI